MKKITSFLACVVILAAWGCSNPKSLRITEKNKENFLDQIKHSKALTVEEVQLLQGYLMHMAWPKGLRGSTKGRMNFHWKERQSES